MSVYKSSSRYRIRGEWYKMRPDIRASAVTIRDASESTPGEKRRREHSSSKNDSAKRAACASLVEL